MYTLFITCIVALLFLLSVRFFTTILKVIIVSIVFLMAAGLIVGSMA